MRNAPPSPPSPDDEAQGRARSPLDWPREAGLGRELAGAIRAEVARRRRTRLRLALATACALLLGGFIAQRAGVFPPGSAAGLASSRVSAPERLALPDGSVVELKPGAALAVDFSPALRRVTLTRGEAHFTVQRNPARPFVVLADGVETRAVGTAFTVSRDTGAVEIVVTEGRVALFREPAPAAPAVATRAEPTLLDAGQRATLAPDAAAAPAVAVLDAAELASRLAWRVPRLEFSGAPLAEVARLFVAHGPVRLTLADPALRDVRVSGILRADNADALLQLLAADHAIEAETRAGEIILRRR